jgi:hypothetical protein
LAGAISRRYHGKPEAVRLLNALDRIVEQARARGAEVPSFAQLADQARATRETFHSVFAGKVEAEANLKLATAACSSAHEEAVIAHHRYAGLIFSLVGPDPKALDAFGLRLRKVAHPKVRMKALGESPAQTEVQPHPLGFQPGGGAQ